MSKFQPEFEKLEARQLLAADLGVADAAVPLASESVSEVYSFEQSFGDELSYNDCLPDVEAEAWQSSDELACLLLADENSFPIEMEVQTDEELVFAADHSFKPDAVDIGWLVG